MIFSSKATRWIWYVISEFIGEKSIARFLRVDTNEFFEVNLRNTSILWRFSLKHDALPTPTMKPSEQQKKFIPESV